VSNHELNDDDFEPTDMVQELINESHVFVGTSEVYPELPTNESSIALYVLCSDTFAYACADAEYIPYVELKNVWLASRSKWGTTIWCCKRRKMQPIPCVKKNMLADGQWPIELELLPKHPLDKS